MVAEVIRMLADLVALATDSVGKQHKIAWAT
jgi:hypothetical protein